MTKEEKILQILYRDKEATKNDTYRNGSPGAKDLGKRRRALVDIYIKQVQNKIKDHVIKYKRTAGEVSFTLKEPLSVMQPMKRKEAGKLRNDILCDRLGLTRVENFHISHSLSYNNTFEIRLYTKGYTSYYCFECMLMDLDISIDEDLVRQIMVLRDRKLSQAKSSNKKRKVRTQVENTRLNIKEAKAVRRILMRELENHLFPEQRSGHSLIGITIYRRTQNSKQANKGVEYLVNACEKIGMNIPKLLEASLRSENGFGLVPRAIKKYLLLRYGLKEHIVLYILDRDEEVRELAQEKYRQIS